MTEVNYSQPMNWPYPVNYGKENIAEADVLVLGGGVAGCHAAINAAKRGAKVIVVDKGAVIRSGNSGAGVDHWHMACTNPGSKVTPEEMVKMVEKAFTGAYSLPEYGNGMICTIMCKESYDALLDIEKMGVQIRDVDDEFAGAEFRDEATKLMFAYDYENKYCVRIRGGANIKPAMYNELKRLGVAIYDHVMVTSLLTEGGRQGARVVGATGVNVRTGEFYVFKAKATILSMNGPVGLWVFSMELKGGASLFIDPNNSGDGTAMAWQAGAELAKMEQTFPMPASGGLGSMPYGTGNADNTWYACTIVDANGKEIPWVNRDGKVLKTVSERYHPAPGQKLFFPYFTFNYEFMGPRLIPDLPERVRKGEYKLPLYADLPSMPELERRAIWGLMVGNEGTTRIPIYTGYGNAGFDPDKDMLQANIVVPGSSMGILSLVGSPPGGPPQWLGEIGLGGVWLTGTLRAALEGLYAAGDQIGCGQSDHSGAATTGRYAGRKATEYAKTAGEPVIDRKQVEAEKTRVYAPVMRQSGVGWKELRAGVCRIMQEYCGETRIEEVLKAGLRWLQQH